MGDPANHSISEELVDWICAHLPAGAIILELGSGEGTGRLARRHSMISIEHDEKFLARYRSTYIHAPIVPFSKQCDTFNEDTGWYDRKILSTELPKYRYHMILVDGPPNAFGRGGFYKWRHFFDLSVPMVFDDLHRNREKKLIDLMSAHVRRPYTVYGAWGTRRFGVIA